HTREFLEAQIAILMGGRVAEELFLRQMTSGAGNDIERATDIARRMVCEFGMSALGPLAYRTPGNPWETDRGAGISEATAQRVDEEVRELVMRGYETARQIVAKNRAAVRALAEELLVVESLDADGIKAIMAAASAPAAGAFVARTAIAPPLRRRRDGARRRPRRERASIARAIVLHRVAEAAFDELDQPRSPEVEQPQHPANLAVWIVAMDFELPPPRGVGVGRGRAQDARRFDPIDEHGVPDVGIDQPRRRRRQAALHRLEGARRAAERERCELRLQMDDVQHVGAGIDGR